MNRTKPLGSVEPMLCSADMTGKENYLVTLESGGIAVTNATTDAISGVIENAAGSGEYADVLPWIPGCFYRVPVNGSVTKGGFLELGVTTDYGKLAPYSAGTRVAKAAESITGAGIILVQALTATGTT